MSLGTILSLNMKATLKPINSTRTLLQNRFNDMKSETRRGVFMDFTLAIEGKYYAILHDLLLLTALSFLIYIVVIFCSYLEWVISYKKMWTWKFDGERSFREHVQNFVSCALFSVLISSCIEDMFLYEYSLAYGAIIWLFVAWLTFKLFNKNS